MMGNPGPVDIGPAGVLTDTPLGYIVTDETQQNPETGRE